MWKDVRLEELLLEVVIIDSEIVRLCKYPDKVMGEIIDESHYGLVLVDNENGGEVELEERRDSV